MDSKTTNEGGGRWLFIGLCVGVVLMGVLYGLPPILGQMAPENCDAECLARLDLPAQTSMASAAWAMFAVTSISVGVGAVSLWLIWMNLVAARMLARDSERSAKAAEDAVREASAARSMTEAQVRAHIAITGVKVEQHAQNAIYVTALVSNSGQTPARNVRVEFIVFVAQPHTEDNQDPWKQEQVAMTFASTIPGGQNIVAVGTEIILAEYAVTLLRMGSALAEVRGTVRYLDIFGKNQAEPFRYGSGFRMHLEYDVATDLHRMPNLVEELS